LLHDSSSESFDCESSTITKLRATSADRNYVIVFKFGSDSLLMQFWVCVAL
jgi:hypothetical protein